MRQVILLGVYPLLFTLIAAPPTMQLRQLRIWDDQGARATLLLYHISVDTPATPIQMRYKAQTPEGGTSDTTWTQATGPVLTAGRVEAFGAMVVSRPAASFTWQATADWLYARSVVQQGRGDAWPDAAIDLSDLVFSDSTAPVVWQHHGIHSFAMIDQPVSRQRAVTVIYQVKARRPRDSVAITVTLTDISNPTSGRRVLQLTTQSRLDAGINELSREVDMRHLRAGRYRLELQVSDRKGDGAAVRALEFELR